jgi:hypothetical protein
MREVAVAAHEARMNADRDDQMVKARGVKLGGDRGAKAREIGCKVRAARAVSRAVDLAPPSRNYRLVA